MAYVFLLLGGNKGNRLKILEDAKSAIVEQIGVIARESSIYETEPWGFKDDQLFLNLLLKVKTEMAVEQILLKLQNIENQLGRQRTSIKWSNRIIDIDILFYDNLVVDRQDLTIPHPRLHQRRFALTPLNEIAKDLIHPSLGKSMKTLLEECEDDQAVTLFAN